MRRKILWTLPIIVLAVVLGGVIKTYAGTGESGRGWLWDGSESPDTNGITPPNNGVVDGNETSLGWLSMNNMDEEGNIIDGNHSYGVDIPSSDGPVTGYAWSENYGWISFKESDLADCPQAAAARSGNKLTGGARVLSIRDAGTNAGGWKGCISLNGSGYGVSIAPNGQIGGYAWSGEHLLPNGLVEGLGWIDFSKAFLAKVLKLCPKQATVNQGATQTFELYNDPRPDCGDGAKATVPADSWSKEDAKNIIQSLIPSEDKKSVKATAVLDTNKNVRQATIIAKYQNKTAKAVLTVNAMLPACGCDDTTAKNTCNTETFPGTVGAPDCLETICNGAKDCSANWREIPPTN